MSHRAAIQRESVALAPSHQHSPLTRGYDYQKHLAPTRVSGNPARYKSRQRPEISPQARYPSAVSTNASRDLCDDVREPLRPPGPLEIGHRHFQRLGGRLPGTVLSDLHRGEQPGLADLHNKVRDAVHCHFDEGKAPKIMRLHFVREEVISA